MLKESMNSILSFNDDVNFYIINNADKPIEDLPNVKQYLFKLNTVFRERLNSKEGPSDRLKNTSYLKLFIPEILKDIDKCLFVDCDCLCFDNIEDIYNKDVDYIRLPEIEINAARKSELGLVNRPYYSTGIMLMNLDALRKTNFREQCFRNIHKIVCSFWCHEETLMNVNFYDKIDAFDKTVQWHKFQTLKYNNFEALRKNIKKIKFLHIGGKDKSCFNLSIPFYKEYALLKKIEILKNKVSVEDFKSGKIKNIIVNPKHTQMKEWFGEKYRIVNSNPEIAEVAVFHGADYFNPTIRNYTDTILKYNIPIISIEDTFLRSIYPARAPVERCYKESVGYCINNYLYFENDKETTIEKFLKECKPLSNGEMLLAKNIMNRIRNEKISKYNCQFKNNFNLKNVVLVIDQAYADQSIIYSNADENTFKEMLLGAIRENPNNIICVKVHPESMTGGRGGFFNDAVIGECEKLTGKKVRRITESYNPFAILNNCKCVYTCSSGLGFEAIMNGNKVITYGCPFYSGFGLTIDRNPKCKCKGKITLEQLVYIVFEKFSIFQNPVDKKPMSTLNAIDYLKRLIAKIRS